MIVHRYFKIRNNSLSHKYMVIWYAQPVLYELKFKEMYMHVAYKYHFSRGVCDILLFTQCFVSLLFLFYLVCVHVCQW